MVDPFTSYLLRLEGASTATGRKLKIAICLYGHFRLYREIYLNFYENMYNPCRICGQTDIFISSWDELNSASSFSSKQNEVSPLCGTFDREDILRKYPAQNAIFENFEKMKGDFHIHNHDSSVDLSSLQPNFHEKGILFGLAQFYRMFKCNEMKKKHEELTGKRYDIVIQMRPDVFFLKRFSPIAVNPSKLSSRTLYNNQLLVSSSENMDKIASVYLQVGRIMQKYKTQKPLWFDPYCPEYFLEHFLAELGFDESRRGEFGEDFMYLYPRKDFLATIHLILSKHNRLSEMKSVLNYPLVSLFT